MSLRNPVTKHCQKGMKNKFQRYIYEKRLTFSDKIKAAKEWLFCKVEHYEFEIFGKNCKY